MYSMYNIYYMNDTSRIDKFNYKNNTLKLLVRTEKKRFLEPGWILGSLLRIQFNFDGKTVGQAYVIGIYCFACS